MSKRGGYVHTPLHTGNLPRNPNFDLIDLDVESELPFDSIESWVGAREGNYRMMMKILPLVGFYEGLYFNVASKKMNHIHPEPPSGDTGRTSVRIHRDGDPDWFISFSLLKDELIGFYRSLIGSAWSEERNLTELEDIDAYLDMYGISISRLEEFHKYYSGYSDYDEKLNPDRRVACAWPMGCSQNHESRKAPFAKLLQREREHCKPKTHGDSESALQSMCYMHNMWKGDHVLWDLHTLSELFFR